MLIPGNIELFENIKAEDIERLLSCLGIAGKGFQKGETIIAQGSAIESIGVVISGRIQVSRNDFVGNRVIVAEFGMGAIFAESFVCAGISRSPVTVSATEAVLVIFLPYRRLMTSCEKACSFHQQLILNLVRLVARKNLVLSGKLEICSRRTIREKVLAYLGMESAKALSREIVIPFTRNELADYLAVDRSALSRELGRMQAEGLIEFDKRRFTLR
jgi:CRP-like cAMP-binding protein